MKKVSVILPTYNESGNIVRLIGRIIENVPAALSYEIVVADDNSPDGTYDLVRETFGDDSAVIAIKRTKDRGLAASIRTGIEASSGDQVIVMDTDFTHDPDEIPRLLHVAEVYDVVSGSRFCPGGNMQDVGHYLASMAYNVYLRLLLRTQIQDNMGGYFTMSREKLNQLPFDSIFFGYGDYFFRLLHFAQKAGMSVVEIPAIYRARTAGTSKSSFLRMLFTYTRSALQLRRMSKRADAVGLIKARQG
ncbi:MAG TPA: glycosyltransferase [Gemmatimonadaceae bacterium]|nr:glycosyltransferase [Gemmatimonadaceae bacterium]